MKPKRSYWKIMAAEWKPTLVMALPIFAFAMWYAMARNYTDLFMYAVVLGLASWHVAGSGVLAWRKIMAWRKQNEETHLPENLSRPESQRDRQQK
jgi:hypothetical protein